MSDYYDRIANSAGTPYAYHGTVYEFRDPSQARLGGSLAGGELERCYMRRIISRCCDGDDHTAHTTLPDRYTTTLADALRYYAAAGEPETA